MGLLKLATNVALFVSAVALGGVCGNDVADRARDVVEREADRQVKKDGFERAKAESKALVVWTGIRPEEFPTVKAKLSAWSVQIQLHSLSDDRSPRIGVIGQDMVEYRVFKNAIHDGTPERLLRLYELSCRH